MALKFLNKKGWHTGSLRNIENVWKAEQKHETEQKKLEELRKQIHEERELSEFRQLQEQAGLVPRQERLEFLYDSGLAVGKGSSSSGAGGSGVAFQALEESTPNINKPSDAAASSGAKQPSAAAPGALFEDKPQSANDAWRKLHSDPLLLIRQREQDALARIKNNPVQMALIRKSAEATKEGKSDDKREHKKKHSHGKARHRKRSPSEEQLDLKDVDRENRRRDKSQEQLDLKDVDRENRRRDKSQHTRSKHDDRYYNSRGALDENSSEMGNRRREDSYRDSSNRDDRFPNRSSDLQAAKDYDKLKREKHFFDDEKGGRKDTEHRSSTNRKERGTISSSEARSCNSSVTFQQDSHYKRHKVAPKLSEEERAAKLQEMQANAQLHEEQRWKRLRRAEEDDAKEAARASVPGGKNFLDAAQRNIYGAEKGGSSTIEESVRRRAYYSQGKSEAGERNAFRR